MMFDKVVANQTAIIAASMGAKNLTPEKCRVWKEPVKPLTTDQLVNKFRTLAAAHNATIASRVK